MKYTGSLVKKEREEIFRLFLERTKLKFSEIERLTGIRSNMVSYHIEKMQKEDKKLLGELLKKTFQLTHRRILEDVNSF